MEGEAESLEQIQQYIKDTGFTKKKRKKIHVTEEENVVHSETETKKKKKSKNSVDKIAELNSALNSSNSLSDESRDDVKKKKRKIKSEENLLEDDSCNIQTSVTDKNSKKKHKRKYLTEEENITDVIESEDSEPKSKKLKKSKNSTFTNSESDAELNTSIEDSSKAEIKKKKRKKSKSEDDCSNIDSRIEVNKKCNKNVVEDNKTIDGSKRKKSKINNEDLFAKVIIKEEYLNSSDENVEEGTNTKKSPKKTCSEIDDSILQKKLNIEELTDRLKKNTSIIEEEVHFAEVNSQKGTDGKKISPKKLKSSQKSTKSNNIKSESEEHVDDSNEVTYREMKILVGKEFIIPFNVPKLHMLHARTSVVPKELRKYIAEKNIVVKTGPYTSEEDEQILKNWKMFCELNKLDENNPMPFFTLKKKDMPRFKMEQLSIFLQFLGHKLDDRTLNCIYDRFKRLVNDNKKRFNRFTEQEDQIILNYLQNCKSNHPIVDLAKMLNRNKISVNKRVFYLNNIKSSKFDHRVKWTMELVNRIVKFIMQHTGCKKIEDLEHCKINKDIWTSISENTKIPVVKLKRRWEVRIYPGLFLPEDVDFSAVLEKLLNLFEKNKYREWRQVNWNMMAAKISENYSGFNGALLHKIVLRLCSVRDLDDNSFEHGIQHIRDVINKDGCKLFYNMVPKLIWNEEGTIQVE